MYVGFFYSLKRYLRNNYKKMRIRSSNRIPWKVPKLVLFVQQWTPKTDKKPQITEMAFIGQRTLQIDIYTVSVQLFLKLPTRLNSEMQWRTHKYLQRKCESSSAKVLRWSENRESPSPPSALTGIRAAIHRHLTCAPLSRNINILQDSEIMSANKMFEAKAKLFTKENNAKPKHKSSIQSGDMQKLNRYFMEGKNTDAPLGRKWCYSGHK